MPCIAGPAPDGIERYFRLRLEVRELDGMAVLENTDIVNSDAVDTPSWQKMHPPLLKKA